MKKWIAVIVLLMLLMNLGIVYAAEETVPRYWLPELEQGAKEINTALMEAGSNKSAFLFYTDVHWNYSYQKAPMLLKYLYQHTGMNKTFFGGDIVDQEGTDYETMAYLWDWRSQVKDLPNHHSVVGNHDDGNTTDGLFTEDYIYAYLLAAEETPDIVRGEKGLYYYIDSPAEKTRYLFLDTAFQYIINDEAQKKFVQEALISTPDSWHIVAVSHIWYNVDYSTTPATISDLTYSGAYLLEQFDNYNMRRGIYAGCDARVEFCIGGHTHWDYDAVSASGIPILLMETESRHVRSGRDCSQGTVNESSVNGIIADYDAGKITVVRVGRGNSRTVALGAVKNIVVKTCNKVSLRDAQGEVLKQIVGGKELTLTGYSEEYDMFTTLYERKVYYINGTALSVLNDDYWVGISKDELIQYFKGE